MEQQQFIVLIIKRLSNDITADESKVLDEWLLSSPGNRRLAEEYRQAWELAPSDEPEELHPDLEASYAQLMERVKPAVPVSTWKVWSQYRARAAAAVGLVAVSLLAYRQFAPQEIPVKMVSAGGADKMEFHLPDGSTVWLRKGAVLHYPEHFEGKTRNVNLEGEACFDVSYNPDQHFRVGLPHGETVEVLGTSFVIKPMAATTVVAVESGKVRFVANADKMQEEVVAAGNRAVCDLATGKINVTKSMTQNDFAWKRGGLRFEHTPMKKAIEDLEQYYGIKIELDKSALSDCAYSASLSDGTPDEAVALFCATFKMKFTNPSPGRYILSGGTCL